MTAPLPPHFDPVGFDQRVVLRLSWAGFLALLEERGESASPKVTYLDGLLEFMSPSPSHERIKKNLARLLELWAFSMKVDLEGYGSETFKRKQKKSGLEPDECYFLGRRAGRKAPDLAIEVVWTRPLVDKLEVYRRLGVREVWVWEVGALTVWSLRGERYLKGRKSKVLPALDLTQLVRFAETDNQTAALRAFHATFTAS